MQALQFDSIQQMADVSTGDTTRGLTLSVSLSGEPGEKVLVYAVDKSDILHTKEVTFLDAGDAMAVFSFNSG